MQSEHVRDWLGAEGPSALPSMERRSKTAPAFGPVSASSEGDKSSFGSAIEAIGKSLSDPQASASEVVQSYARGSEGPVHEQVVALEKSDIQFKFAVAMKNKFIEAYKQTMSMGS